MIAAVSPHIALATCASLPDLDPDERLVIGPLRARGATVSPAVWDDPAIDWDRFDLVVIRSTWDYTAHRAAFVAWARSVPRIVNAAEIVEWNTDKRYLADLAAAGLPVVPTSWIAPTEAVVLPATGVHVLKPQIGAGSVDAGRFNLDDAGETTMARAHANRLLSAGHVVMVQPYLDGIDLRGETGVVFLGGRYSHAISKGAMLVGERHKEAAGLYVEETIEAREPTADELELAQRALAAVPADAAELAYARVDLVPDRDGSPLIIELELTEPSLFMGTAPGSAERFANVLLRLAEAKKEAGRAPQRGKPGL